MLDEGLLYTLYQKKTFVCYENFLVPKPCWSEIGVSKLRNFYMYK